MNLYLLVVNSHIYSAQKDTLKSGMGKNNPINDKKKKKISICSLFIVELLDILKLTNKIRR